MKTRLLLVPLLVPLLALSVLGAAPRRAPLPPLPTTAYSRYGPVRVERVVDVVCPSDSTGVTPVGTLACFSTADRRIQIVDTLDLRFATFALEHEKVHVAFRDLHVNFDDPKDEERVASIIARYRLGELESRP